MLVVVPLAVLVLLSPFQFLSLTRSRDRTVPWCYTVVAKITLNSLLVLLNLVNLIYFAVRNDTAYGVHYFSAVFKTVSYACALAIACTCKVKGLVTSGPLLYFWLLTAVCSAVTYRSALLTLRGTGPEEAAVGLEGTLVGTLPLATALIEFPLAVAMLFLNAWADQKPSYIDLHSTEHPSEGD